MLTQAQLDQILRIHIQLNGTQPLGALFVQRGLLTLGQVQELLRLQRSYDQQRPNAGGAPLATPRPAPTGAARPVAAPPSPTPIARPDVNPFLNPPRNEATAKPAASPPRPAPAHAAPAPTGIARPIPARGAIIGRVPAPTPPAVEDELLSPAPAARGLREPPPAAAPPAPAPAAPAPRLDKQGWNAKVARGGGKLVVGLIEEAEANGASDLHFHGGAPLAVRVQGRLNVLEQTLDPKDQERELLSILTEEQRKQFKESGDLDFAYVLPSGLRTRANMYRSLAGTDATFRLIPREPQTLAELQLPSAVARLTAYHQGLVLVTGPAGCGKSTTLAALINLLNEERTEHILTLEDPIEILHPEKRALVNQRQVGRDTESFARALRGALREDPDIIMIGDLRDRETISLAITAAETGHLVIGSMNTSNAGRTVGRLIDAFPPTQQGQVRAMLSESLRGVVSQRLVSAKDGKRVPAAELLIVTPAIGNLIREGKLFQIRSQMQVGKHLGMRTLDESLRELVTSGVVDANEARVYAENPAALGGAAPAAPAAAAPAPPNTPAGNPPAGAPKPGQPQQRPPATPARPGVGVPRAGTR